MPCDAGGRAVTGCPTPWRDLSFAKGLAFTGEIRRGLNLEPAPKLLRRIGGAVRLSCGCIANPRRCACRWPCKAPGLPVPHSWSPADGPADRRVGHVGRFRHETAAADGLSLLTCRVRMGGAVDVLRRHIVNASRTGRAHRSISFAGRTVAFSTCRHVGAAKVRAPRHVRRGNPLFPEWGGWEVPASVRARLARKRRSLVRGDAETRLADRPDSRNDRPRRGGRLAKN